ncbi:hypothetical protein HaLaN_19867 [Haematococcus lacustris]|uniref:Uncharacterized protein n=1 Tax=Haematococcus lacustris TaxID=44745 RepID=A0A699ZI48_HAELA|nr:hypothetical protein HaLaN_19867 [Haematococcus lacustris]
MKHPAVEQGRPTFNHSAARPSWQQVQRAAEQLYKTPRDSGQPVSVREGARFTHNDFDYDEARGPQDYYLDYLATMDEDVRQRRQPAMPPPRGNSPASPILLDAEQLHRPTWENDDLETLVNDSQLMAALSTTASHNVSTAHPTPTHDRPMQASRIKKALHILYQPVVHHQQAVKAKQPLPATPPRAPTQPQPTGLCPQGEPTAAPVLQGLASGGPKNGLEDSPACSQHDVWPGDASAAAGAPSAPGPSASSSDQYPQAPPPDAGSGSGSFTDNPDLAEVMNQLHGQHEGHGVHYS